MKSKIVLSLNGRITNPGSRGGHFWYDKEGNVRYGPQPLQKQPAVQQETNEHPHQEQQDERSTVLSSPMVLYHVTNPDNISAIKKRGLIPPKDPANGHTGYGAWAASEDERDPESIYLATFDQAKALSNQIEENDGTKPAMVEVYLPKGTRVFEDEEMPESSIKVRGNISPKRIRIMGDTADWGTVKWNPHKSADLSELFKSISEGGTQLNPSLIVPKKSDPVIVLEKANLPDGGKWITFGHSGHKVYVKDGVILAGSVPHWMLNMKICPEIRDQPGESIDEHVGHPQEGETDIFQKFGDRNKVISALEEADSGIRVKFVDNKNKNQTWEKLKNGHWSLVAGAPGTQPGKEIATGQLSSLVHKLPDGSKAIVSNEDMEKLFTALRRGPNKQEAKNQSEGKQEEGASEKVPVVPKKVGAKEKQAPPQQEAKQEEPQSKQNMPSGNEQFPKNKEEIMEALEVFPVGALVTLQGQDPGDTMHYIKQDNGKWKYSGGNKGYDDYNKKTGWKPLPISSGTLATSIINKQKTGGSATFDEHPQKEQPKQEIAPNKVEPEAKQEAPQAKKQQEPKQETVIDSSGSGQFKPKADTNSILDKLYALPTNSIIKFPPENTGIGETWVYRKLADGKWIYDHGSSAYDEQIAEKEAKPKPMSADIFASAIKAGLMLDKPFLYESAKGGQKGETPTQAGNEKTPVLPVEKPTPQAKESEQTQTQTQQQNEQSEQHTTPGSPFIPWNQVFDEKKGDPKTNLDKFKKMLLDIKPGDGFAISLGYASGLSPMTVTYKKNDKGNFVSVAQDGTTKTEGVTQGEMIQHLNTLIKNNVHQNIFVKPLKSGDLEAQASLGNLAKITDNMPPSVKPNTQPSGNIEHKSVFDAKPITAAPIVAQNIHVPLNWNATVKSMAANVAENIDTWLKNNVDPEMYEKTTSSDSFKYSLQKLKSDVNSGNVHTGSIKQMAYSLLNNGVPFPKSAGDPSDYVFEGLHGTGEGNLASILYFGFLPSMGLHSDFGTGVYLKAQKYDHLESSGATAGKIAGQMFAHGACVKVGIKKSANILDLSGQKVDGYGGALKLPNGELVHSSNQWHEYATKNGIDLIIGKLPVYPGEGIQLCAYNPGILEVLDWGKGMKYGKLIKALNKSGMRGAKFWLATEKGTGTHSMFIYASNHVIAGSWPSDNQAKKALVFEISKI